ncbi:2OG-Fe(II) oxygenase [Antarcticibacterium flavum]|uniref:2OG-Fe(II) oxygenase n=1 Tax=Antarcticibacterium flavum TaxID=2058175 RepID=A0A5B7X2B7_9FLAO|nr:MULTISPECIES: 2OG-Fe(II) oxygenase [Antarcticibacterium]MCM4160143.1 oxidoreductase [Antarcticibacterium sp. W02-3]QCY69694.1 2OG-Fe(II) oxygenase [Antarcticibacterium flavum]
MDANVELFEQLEFQENPLYEKIISGLLEDQYCIVEDFFDAEEIQVLRRSLLQKYEEDNFKKAAIGNKLNETIEKAVRGDFILWINEADAGEAERIFFNKINSLVSYLNKTCFLGILQKEFHYAVYPEGTFYKRHLDTFQNDDRRKLSLVCYLNDEDWAPENGGELVIYKEENGVETAKSIYPFPGRVVIFESQLLEHEVKPVKTTRLSITGWLKTR